MSRARSRGPATRGYDEERTGFNFAVRAAGHGYSVPTEGGLLITTGRMSGVDVDPAARTVTVEGRRPLRAGRPETVLHGPAPLNAVVRQPPLASASASALRISSIIVSGRR